MLGRRSCGKSSSNTICRRSPQAHINQDTQRPSRHDSEGLHSREVYEPRRNAGLESNSRINWEYYRGLFPGSLLWSAHGRTEMNDEDLVAQFMREIADRQFSDWTAKKAFTYVKALLDTARDLGVTTGNAARLIPENTSHSQRRVKKATSQPAVSINQYVAMLNEIKKPRDRT